jgi:hypothetical protein|tara:strand:- start:3325 stop:3429 length:105 start_codon:yes stop_codon:yes gene_type:complete
MKWILALLALGAFFTWALCRIAAQADEKLRQWYD